MFVCLQAFPFPLLSTSPTGDFLGQILAYFPLALRKSYVIFFVNFEKIEFPCVIAQKIHNFHHHTTINKEEAILLIMQVVLENNNSVIDALPYVDPYNEAMKKQVEALVKEEMRRFDPPDYLSQLPPPPATNHEVI